MNGNAAAHAAERLAVECPKLCVVDERGQPVPLSTAMFLRIVLVVVDAYGEYA